jgi:hypothetical protein
MIVTYLFNMPNSLDEYYENIDIYAIIYLFNTLMEIF